MLLEHGANADVEGEAARSGGEWTTVMRGKRLKPSKVLASSGVVCGCAGNRASVGEANSGSASQCDEVRLV
jgi:hypothetical protein